MNKKVDAVLMGCLIVLMMLGHILRLYDVEISIYLILLGGALYCAAFAFINLSGNELFIDKKYRGMDEAKRWQRETVLPALLSSAGCIAFGCSMDNPSISQRNSCLVSGLTSDAFFGH